LFAYVDLRLHYIPFFCFPYSIFHLVDRLCKDVTGRQFASLSSGSDLALAAPRSLLQNLLSDVFKHEKLQWNMTDMIVYLSDMSRPGKNVDLFVAVLIFNVLYKLGVTVFISQSGMFVWFLFIILVLLFF
jgi:hypothetical protein